MNLAFILCPVAADTLLKWKSRKNHVYGAVVAQVASARLSERVPGSILGDLNVCFDFLFFTFQLFIFSF